MRRHRVVLGAWVAVALAALAAPASRAVADPIAVRSGKVVLPITGLAIELPRDPRKAATWKLSGSWSLTDGGAAFDGRDVVDLEVGGKLVAGNWIHLGYFNAGGCAAVVEELDVADRWRAEADLYGLHFQVAGGTWDFENDLGKVPALALCTPAERGGSLLLYHFFLEARPPAGKAGIAVIAKDKLLDRVARAWKAGKTGPVLTTRRPEIRRRGDLAAVRTVTLAQSKLEVALPDDGFVWLARSPADGSSDFLDRMAPSLPDVTIEVATVPGQTCAALQAGLVGAATVVAEPPPLGVPAGWVAYPTIAVEDRHERVICRDVGQAALIAGLLVAPKTAPAARDFGPYAPVLQALVDAAGR